jgi:hypothetical protein
MKVIILMLILIWELGAVDRNEVLGKWKAVAKSTNNGTLTIEKEYLHLNTDRSFTIILLVSVQKDDAYIKDLKIKGSGIWKVHENTLVAVVNKMEVPFAKEVYLISQASLRNLAESFKRRFQEEPIRILKIKSVDRNSLITENESLKQTHYSRY